MTESDVEQLLGAYRRAKADGASYGDWENAAKLAFRALPYLTEQRHGLAESLEEMLNEHCDTETCDEPKHKHARALLRAAGRLP